MIKKNLKWALVLSGGGAKGIAHIGVLDALADMGVPPPSLVVGTSMGAIVGGAYACGVSPRELKRIILDEFNISEYLESFVFRIAGPAGKIFQAGQILGNLATRPGIDSGQRLLKFFERLTSGKNFDETDIPFRCNAVDLCEGREFVFRTGAVAPAIRASMSFPLFFEPLVDGNRCFADGGIADNMPAHIAHSEGFRRILAVDVGSFKPIAPAALRTVLDIAYRSLETIICEHERTKKWKASLTIHASDTTSPLDFNRKQELVDLGARAVKENEKTIAAFFSCGPAACVSRMKVRECGIIG